MLSLAVSTLAVIIALVLPGYCLMRAVGVARTWSFALSPAISVAALSLLGEAYAKLGIDATPISILVIPSAVFVVIAAVRRFKTDTLSLPRLRADHLAFYVVVGFAVGYVVFVRSMGQTDSYFRGVDLVQHLNEIRAFIDSKTFTSLTQSYYLADPALDPAPVHGWYPSGYHVIGALAAMISGQSLTTIINAVNLCACALVWTMSLAAFFAVAFEDIKHGLILGALVSVSSSLFPWGLLIFGPIFPNLLSFAMVPAVAALFVFALRVGIAARERVCALALMVLTLVGMVFTQPNATFTAAVFLIPFVASRILSLKGYVPKYSEKPIPAYASRLLCLAFLVVCVCIWIGCLYLPFLRGTVTFVWNFKKWWLDAILNALCFSHVYGFAWVAAQIPLGVLLILGVIYVIYKRKLRWLAWTALLGEALYYVCITNTPPIKNYAGGFWYTDPWRMSCMAVMLSLPMCVLGLVWLAELCEKALVRIREKRAAKRGEQLEDASEQRITLPLVKRIQPLPSSVACSIVAVLFVIVGYWGCVGPIEAPAEGGFLVPYNESGWTCLRRTIVNQYRLEAPYTRDERAFVQEVKELVGDEPVLNDPFDGSVIAYGADGLHTVYRYVREYDTAKETAESSYLREHIADVATDEEVQRILEEDNIHYLLNLSHADYHGSFFMGDDTKGTFIQIEDIDENTSGFEVVLEKDGMQLFRITALDDDAD